MGKLYIIEGMPCSGKSTTAKYISDQLKKTGKNVVFVDEGTGNHPADYEFHSFISMDVFDKLDDNLKSKIQTKAEVYPDGYIIPLSGFEGQEFDTLLQYKIYDFLPWETEMPIMLNKWQEFVNKALADNNVYVFNCVFLQNPMCETMMRFGFDIEQSLEYISKINKIIKPLDPTVIYLKSDNIAERVKETATERDGWLESVIDYHVNGAYGKSIKAEGFDGYIACLLERQKRELKILKQLTVKDVIINNAHNNWSKAYKQIDDFNEL